MADLKSLFAQQDAARQTAPARTTAPATGGGLSPEERAEYSALLQKQQQDVLGRKGNYATKQHGEIDTSLGRGGDFLGRMGRGFTSTLGAIPKGLGELYEGTIGDNDTKGNLLTDIGEGIESFGRRADINPEYNETTLANIGQGLGSAGAFILPGGLAGGAIRAGSAAAKVASYGVPGVMGGLAGASEQVEDYKASTGEDPKDAAERLRLAAYGLAGGATEALPFGRVVGRGFGSISDDVIKGMAGKAGKVGLGATAKQAGKQGLVGAIEEGGQEVFQNTLRNYVAKEAEAYDEERALSEGLGTAAETGGAVGFIMNAAMSTMGIRVRAKELGLTNKIDEAEATLRGQEAEKAAKTPIENKTGQIENTLNTGATTPTATSGQRQGEAEYIVPGIERKKYPTKHQYMQGKKVQGGKLGGTMLDEEGPTYTARDMVQQSFKNMQTISNYEKKTPESGTTFTASQRRDAEVLAALPEEEQQLAMDGKSSSPAANKAAHVASETVKIQELVKEATDIVGQTALAPEAKAKAVERRVQKAVKEAGFDLDGDEVIIPDGSGWTTTKPAKPTTGEATAETEMTKKEPKKPVKDDRTPEQRSVDVNLDLVEAQFDSMRGKFTSKTPNGEKAKMEGDYVKAFTGYTNAVMKANPKLKPEEAIKQVTAELQQLGIYHPMTETVDAKTMVTNIVEGEEAINDLVEKSFPIIEKGRYKGNRSGGNLTFPISEMDTYREALKERGLYAHKISQNGNEVRAWIGTAGKKRADNDPFEKAAFNQKGETRVSLKKMAEATVAPDEKFFPDQKKVEQEAGIPNTEAKPLTPKQESIDLMSKQGVVNLRKAADSLGITYSRKAGPRGLATLIYNKTNDDVDAQTTFDKVQEPLSPREIEQFFGEEYSLTEKPKPVTEKPATSTPKLDSPTMEALKGVKMSPAARVYAAKQIEAGKGTVEGLKATTPTGKGKTPLYTKKDVENYFIKEEVAAESKDFVEAMEGTPRKERAERNKREEAPPPPEAEEFFGNFPSEGTAPQTKSGEDLKNALTFLPTPLTKGEIAYVSRVLDMPDIRKGDRKTIDARAKEAGLVNDNNELILKNLSLDQRKALYDHVVNSLPAEQEKYANMFEEIMAAINSRGRQQTKDGFTIINGDIDRLTPKQKKDVEAEAEALRKEIRDIEEEGVPFEDDYFGDYDVSDGTQQPFDPRERQNRIAQYKTTWDKLSTAVRERGAARLTEEKRAYRQFLADYAGTDGHPTGVAYEPSINFMTTSEVMDMLVEGLPEGSAYKYLAQKLRGLDLNTTVSFDADMRGRVHPSTGERMAPNGLFNDVDNTIKLNPKLLEKPNTGIKTLLHEVVHAATVRAIYNNPKFMSEVNTLMNTARKAAAKRGVRRNNDNHHIWYGLTNESEFIAEMMTNVEFQKFLNTVYIRSNLTNKVTTLWKEFVASVARFIGVDVQLGSVLEASLQISERYMVPQSTKDMLLDKGQVIKQNKGKNLTDEIRDWKYDPRSYNVQRVKDAQLARTMSEYDLPASSNPQRLQGNDLKKSKSLIEKYTKLAEKNGLKLHVSWDGSMNDMPTWVLDGTNLTKENKAKISLEHRSVAMFANNIPDYESFKRVMFHEVLGHFSMESLFGEEQYARFITNLSKNPQWGKEMALLKAEYQSGGIEMTDLQAGKELVARMAETGTTPNLFNRVVAWVKHHLRKYGYSKDDITNNDIQNYIAQASKQFENGTLPELDFQNPIVMNSFVNNLFSGAIQRGTDVEHSKRTMTQVVDKLFTVNKNLDEYQGSWSQAANDLYEDFAKTKVARYYSALKDLPFQQVYNYVRQIGLGDSSAYDQRASRIWFGLEKINDSDRERLYQYLTTKDDELPANWGEGNQRDLAIEAKETIMSLGDELVKHKFLEADKHEATKGKYLHTAYLAFMMNEDKAASIYGGGAKLSLQGYLKEKTLDDEVAKQALGWIDDPVLMASQSIAMVGRDVALLRMADAMSYSSNKMGSNMWMTPDVPGIATVVSGTRTINEGTPMEQEVPKKMSPFMALQQIADLRKNVLARSHPSKKPGLKRLYDQEEAKVREHLAKWGADNDYTNLGDIDVSKYEFVEHGKRNGAFSGRFIKKEIYNDVRASYAAFAAENPGVVEKLIGQYGALTKVNRFWKNTKTVWNPPTHVRNFIGNFVNLDISTSTNSLKLGKMVGEEGKRYLEAIANNTSMESMPYYWRVADKLGITETTFTAQEARQILGKWKTQHAGGKAEDWLDQAPDHAPVRWLKENMPTMRGGFHTIADLMGNTYQGSETLFKVVKLRDTMERYEKKMGIKIENIQDEAERTALESRLVQEAQRWIFDYSAVPRSIRYLRNAPIGAPFISFSYLALPRMFEASAKHPVKIMKYMTLPYAVGQISAMAGAFDEGEDKRDWETVKQSLPAYQKEKYSVMPVWWRDDNGNPIMWDLGYYVPFSPYVEAARAYSRKFITGEDPDMPMLDPILDMGILSGPIPDVLTAIKSGEDPFTSKPIIRPNGTTGEKIWDGMTYGWSTAAPTFLTDKGWAGKTLQVLLEDTDNYNPRTGERKETLPRATARLAGFTTNAVNLSDSRATNIRYMEGQISKIKATASKEIKAARAAGKSPQELADIRKKYTDKIKVYRTNLSNYRQRSS